VDWSDPCTLKPKPPCYEFRKRIQEKNTIELYYHTKYHVKTDAKAIPNLIGNSIGKSSPIFLIYLQRLTP
jgi:hypothetical protein